MERGRSRLSKGRGRSKGGGKGTTFWKPLEAHVYDKKGLLRESPRIKERQYSGLHRRKVKPSMPKMPWDDENKGD